MPGLPIVSLRSQASLRTCGQSLTLIEAYDKQVDVKEGYLYWTGMESDSRTLSVLIPTRRGDPLLVATH